MGCRASGSGRGEYAGRRARRRRRASADSSGSARCLAARAQRARIAEWRWPRRICAAGAVSRSRAWPGTAARHRRAAAAPRTRGLAGRGPEHARSRSRWPHPARPASGCRRPAGWRPGDRADAPVEAAKFGQDRQGAAPLPLARIAEPRDGGAQFVHRPLHELGRLVGDRVDGVTIEKLAIEPAGLPPVPLARQRIAQVAQPCRHARVRIGTGPPAERLRKHAPDHQGAPESDGLGAAKRKGGPVAQILRRAQVLLERDAIPCGPAREHDSRHPEGILPGNRGHQIARRTLPRPIRDVRGKFRPPCRLLSRPTP